MAFFFYALNFLVVGKSLCRLNVPLQKKPTVMSEEKLSIEELGEFGLISHLTEKFKDKREETIRSIGDDAAVIGKGKIKTVVSTDMLVEGVHFDLSYVPLKHLGYKAVVVNVSDIYAMNAEPKQITVSIAVSSKFPLEALEELYEGIHRACEVYNVDLIGGDTSTSLSGLTISITAIGEAEEPKIVYRNTAQDGDLLICSGDYGGAYMGLQLLEREKQVFKAAPSAQPKLDGNDYVLERQLKPEARKDIIKQLAEIEVVPTSMIDVSDGLASEIFHIATQSDLGCQIYEDKIPIDEATYNLARDFNLDPTVCALNGGEDYELLLTVSQTDFDKFKNNPFFSIIGHMTDKPSGVNMVIKDRSVVPLKAQGWNHMNKEE